MTAYDIAVLKNADDCARYLKSIGAKTGTERTNEIRQSLKNLKENNNNDNDVYITAHMDESEREEMSKVKNKKKDKENDKKKENSKKDKESNEKSKKETTKDKEQKQNAKTNPKEKAKEKDTYGIKTDGKFSQNFARLNRIE